MKKIKIMALIIGVSLPALAIGYVSASYSYTTTGPAKVLNNDYFSENGIEVFRFIYSASTTEACYLLKDKTTTRQDNWNISCVK